MFVTVNAMGILPQPLRSRRIKLPHLLLASTSPQPPHLRFDTALFEGCRATAYERITQLLATGPEQSIALTLQLCEGGGEVVGLGHMPLNELLAERSERREVREVIVRAVAGAHVPQGTELAVVSVSVTPDWNVINSATDHLRHRRQRMQRELRQEEGEIGGKGQGGAPLSEEEEVQLARAMGSQVTAEDIEEVKSAGAMEGRGLSASSLRATLPRLEEKYYSLAREASKRGDLKAAHEAAQKALRLSTASGPDVRVNTLQVEPSKSKHRNHRDTFINFR